MAGTKMYVTGHKCRLTAVTVLRWINNTGVDLGGGAGGAAPPPRDDLRFSNTTGILPKKNYVVYW